MDEYILKSTSELQYQRMADRGFSFAPADFGIEFTRIPKNEVDQNPYDSFTDGASRAFRIPFPRKDYSTQLPLGAASLRGKQPRMREIVEIPQK